MILPEPEKVRHCPSCQCIITAATAADGSDAEPKPGDITCCLYCEAFLKFGEGLAVEELTDEMFNMIDEEGKEALNDARRFVRHYASMQAIDHLAKHN